MSDETQVDTVEPEGPVTEPPFDGSSGLAVDEIPRTGEFSPEEPAVEPEPASEPEPEPQEEDAKPAGYDQVDFQNDDRDKIEQRFHRLYGQMKQSQSINDQMIADQRAMYERIQNMEVGQAQANAQATLGHLQAQLQEAMDVGDAARSTQIISQISQMTANAAVPPANYGQPATQPAQPQAQDQEHPDVPRIREWGAQRPWMQEGSPDRAWGAMQLNDMYNSPEWADRPVEEKLAQLEKTYTDLRAPSRQADTTQPQVLGQEGSPRPKSSGTVSLNNDQKAIAVRMFPDKTAAEAHKAYAKGL